MSRTEKSLKNMKYAILGQVVVTLMAFVTRMVFVRALNQYYLGVNGLFGNIITMLSLAELGVGSSIIYSLYKPLAENDEGKVAALMKLYKKAYMWIGIVVALLGIILLPFLDIILGDTSEIPVDMNITVVYLLFLLNSVMGYFYAYKQSLLSADQKEFVITNFRSLATIILNVAQIIFLLLTHQYLIYLILQVISTLVLNILLARRVDKMYPYLKNPEITAVSKGELDEIIRNVKALFFHKIGGFVISGTDNILIANMTTIAIVGLYSNYLMIINALNLFYGIVFRSLSASVGNLGVTASKEKLEENFNVINFLGFWLFGFSVVCLVILFTPFIRLWIGEDYLLSNFFVAIIIFNFYLGGMRTSVLTFRDTLGLFWYDRYKPIFESITNLVVSIVLGLRFGAPGVLLGTTFSVVTICLSIEPYVLYKYGLKTSLKKYYFKYVVYGIALLINLFIVKQITNFIYFDGIVGFIVVAAVTVILSNLIFILFFHRTKEFKYLYHMMQGRIAGLFGKIRSRA